QKIPESPWGSPIPIGDGDGNVNRFPDGDGDGDGDDAKKRGWGWVDRDAKCKIAVSSPLGHVTPLFPNMLAQAVVDEGEAKDAQAAKILQLKSRIKKLEKKCKPNISHHKAWLRSVSRLSRMKKLGKKESVSKQGRKNAKPGPTLDAFDDLDADLAHVIAEDKGSGEKVGSTISTARPEVDTARPDIGTAGPEVHTANAPVSTAGVTISIVDPEVSVVEPSTPLTTTSIFDDEDITMAQTLIKMKEEKAKEKGVAFKDVEDSSRPVRSITTLKPLPSIDPKDKGNGILVEEEPLKIKEKRSRDRPD
ncbi:hypothetical protein Tco_0183326, partial [Tanacetum coccineum]